MERDDSYVFKHKIGVLDIAAFSVYYTTGAAKLRLANRTWLFRSSTAALLTHNICVDSCGEEACKLLCATLSFGLGESLISFCENDGLQKKIVWLFFQ